jgi:hypothetical protein
MINSVKSFVAVSGLFDFLDDLGITISQNTHNILSQDYGEFEPCYGCGETSYECTCLYDDAPDYYADDEPDLYKERLENEKKDSY